MKMNFLSGCLKSLRLAIAALVLLASAMLAKAQEEKDPAVVGRWDLTVMLGSKTMPSWLEVQRSGNNVLIGRFVGNGGSARPISEVKVDNGKYSFSIPPQWESTTRYVDFAFEVDGDNLKGTMVATDGVPYNFTGLRAPKLARNGEPVWGKPIKLFNGKDMSGWHTDGKNQWIVEDGVLKSQHSGANLLTDSTFTDFKLHVEFRYQQGSNSGIYLRGRYEVQIIDTKSGQPEPINNQFSSVYGFLPPNQMTAKDPGEWQSFDITLIGRLVTVVANGKTVICQAEIPGITGGAINSREGEPGPILIQGDHGPIDLRNIVITPVR
jgi:hypothetical protein